MPLLGALLLGGCEPSGEPPVSDPELRESLDIPSSVTIHRITLGGRGGAEHLVPPHLALAPGEVVQFVTADRRPHTVFFEEDSLAVEAAAFLEETGQLSSPPLLDRGSGFVVTFRNAPPGRYPFRVEGPGGAVRGALTVSDVGGGGA